MCLRSQQRVQRDPEQTRLGNLRRSITHNGIKYTDTSINMPTMELPFIVLSALPLYQYLMSDFCLIGSISQFLIDRKIIKYIIFMDTPLQMD